MLGNILVTACNVYIGIIFIYILMSWLPAMNGWIRDIYQALGAICDPYLDIFRRIIPPVGGGGMGIDFSPVIAVIVLEIVVNFIARLL